jgi:hypothetical protein
MKVEGIKAVHAIITDECRKNKGEFDAIVEATNRITTEYVDFLVKTHPIGKGVKFHVVLSVEEGRPQQSTISVKRKRILKQEQK